MKKNKDERISNIKSAIEGIDNKIRKLKLTRDDLTSSLEKLTRPVSPQTKKTTQEKEEQSNLDRSKFQERLTKLQSSENDPVFQLFLQKEGLSDK